jgi:hypothetical protein
MDEKEYYALEHADFFEDEDLLKDQVIENTRIELESLTSRLSFI